MRQAARIAINRTVAGVHFPVDSVAGALLGLTLAEYLVALCTDETKYRSSSFDGSRYPVSQDRTGEKTDFNWEHFYDIDTQRMEIGSAARGYAKLGRRPHTIGAKPMSLRWLWEKAKAEWDIGSPNGKSRGRSNGRSYAPRRGNGRRR
jgi:hypothetical protein